MEKLSIKKILGFCGACIAFYIGAGFATMQEVIQYEASYGSQFWVVIAVAALIYVYTNISFVNNGNRMKLKNGGDIYDVYCGKYIGKVFNYFSAIFCYMSFVVMCGGANSTAMEQWGMSNGVGAILMAIMVIATALFGLNGIIKALGLLGPVIILMIICVSCVTSVMGWGNLSEGIAAVDSHKYEITQVGGGNPLASGASYGGFVILWFAAFLGGTGARHNAKEVNIGVVISTFAIFGVAAICCIALITNIDVTWNVGVPALQLAKMIHPALAAVFAVIIFIGIYSSACPLLWTGVRKLAQEDTKKYKYLTIAGGALGCMVSCFFDYRPLLNVLYGMNGYLGFILVAFMIVNDMRMAIKNK